MKLIYRRKIIMAVLEGLKPERVFYYFEELCKIPHGSYNTKEISDHLVEFAKAHGLEYRQDESNNVVIRKPATPGYENAPVVILQGHSDMVCEKVAGSDHDFTKDGLKLMVEGDFITADGTTLGGDDGIAVAYALAILEDDTLKHPALEVIITSDEEVGLLGAVALDTSDIKGRYLINMDSEEEGFLWISCAGGLGAACELPVRYEETEGTKYEILVDGLTGGHSGAEIDKIRANSNKLMGQFLYELKKDVDFRIVVLEGGLKDNAIPRSTKAVIMADAEAEAVIKEKAAIFQANLRTEYGGTDENISASVTVAGEATEQALDLVSQEKVIFFTMHMPYGIEKMSGQIEDLVETSANPGVMKLGDAFRVTFSVRSSVGSAKWALTDKIIYLTEFLGGTCDIEGDYPAWEFRPESKLRDLMAETYEEMFGVKPEVKALHAGLECGIFYEKIENLDAVSFGPTMKDIHTTEEKLCISSVERMWNYLVKVLEDIH